MSDIKLVSEAEGLQFGEFNHEPNTRTIKVGAGEFVISGEAEVNVIPNESGDNSGQ